LENQNERIIRRQYFLSKQYWRKFIKCLPCSIRRSSCASIIPH